MELTGSSSNTQQSHSSGGSHDAGEEIFVNHAEIAWYEMRREWVGNQPKRPPKAPTMSLTTSFEEMLISNEPFPQPIPLTVMVSFLVNIWHEEGCFDVQIL